MRRRGNPRLKHRKYTITKKELKIFAGDSQMFFSTVVQQGWSDDWVETGSSDGIKGRASIPGVANNHDGVFVTFLCLVLGNFARHRGNWVSRTRSQDEV